MMDGRILCKVLSNRLDNISVGLCGVGVRNVLFQDSEIEDGSTKV